MEMFGHYRIEESLGSGRTGEVHRAYDTRAQHTVALKRLRTGLPDADALRDRFRSESEIVAGLVSPYLIPIHEVGEIDGRPFIAMRLIGGRDLATVLLESGPMSPSLVVTVVRQVALALHAAHQAGLVHRDVKPANVVLDERARERTAYLVDFGIATDATPETDTAPDTALGSPAYLAPEMFFEVAVDRRTDVYALACLTFELLTARPPFGVHGSAAMAEHLTLDPPRLTHTRPDLPPELDDVLIRGMAKRPDDRHPTTVEFAGDLLRAAGPLPPADPRPERPRRFPRRAELLRVVGAVVVLAAVVAIPVAFSDSDSDRAGSGTDRTGAPPGPTAAPPPERPTASPVTTPVGPTRTGPGRNDPVSLAAVRSVYPGAGRAGCAPATPTREYFVPLASIGCRTSGVTVYYEVWKSNDSATGYFLVFGYRLMADSRATDWFLDGYDRAQGPYRAARYGDDHVVIALYRDRRYGVYVVADSPEAAAAAFETVGARPVGEVPL